MEDRVNFPLRGNVKVKGCVEYDHFNFKWASLFHLEFFQSSHVEIGHL